MGDRCPVLLGSREFKLPKSRQCKKALKRERFRAFLHWRAACCRVMQSSFIQTVLSASEFHRINLAVRGL